VRVQVPPWAPSKQNNLLSRRISALEYKPRMSMGSSIDRDARWQGEDD